MISDVRPLAALLAPVSTGWSPRSVLMWFLEHGLDLPAKRNNGDIVWRRQLCDHPPHDREPDLQQRLRLW